MLKRTLPCLALAGAVLAFIPAECFAWGRAEVDAACAAMNATYSPSSQRCVCKPGFTESNNACVPNGASSGGNAGSGYDNGAAIREQQRRDEERRQRDVEADQQRKIEANRRHLEEAEEQARFQRERDATKLRGSAGSAASSGSGLRGSTATSGGAGLRGSSADNGLRGSRTGTATPNTDAMVVDARDVPSALPKALDKAIAKAYASAPPGVNDRVRKGFQAVMERDWKVAHAWFQDALNRDPSNIGLKHLVALADPSQQHSEVDVRTEPAGLGGRSAMKAPGGGGNKPKPAPAAAPNLQVPDPSDLRFLFPEIQTLKDKEPPVFRTLPDGSVIQLPQDSDLEFLFGHPSPAASPRSGRTK